MQKMLRYFLAFVLAVLSCVVLASIFSTQRVISKLNASGASADMGDRFSMAVYDLIHFAPLYGIFILLALGIAFFAGGLVFRVAKFGRAIVYVVAGAAAIFVMLSLMKQVFFGVPIVGGARDGFGLSLQILAGGIGGYVFHRLSLPKTVKIA